MRGWWLRRSGRGFCWRWWGWGEGSKGGRGSVEWRVGVDLMGWVEEALLGVVVRVYDDE